MNYLSSRNHNGIFTQYFGPLLHNIFYCDINQKHQCNFMHAIKLYFFYRYNITRSSDRSWGGRNGTEFTGMIGMLVRHVSIPSLIHIYNYSSSCVHWNQAPNFVLGSRCSIIRHDNHLWQVHGGALQHTIRLRQSHICDPKANDES